MISFYQGLYCIVFVFLFYIVLNAIKRKYFSSHAKPLITCFIDAFLSIPFFFKLGAFGRPNDIHEAVVQAIKSTGLSDFVGTSHNIETAGFIERYDMSRKLGLERSGAEYSPSGYLLALSTLTRRLEVRLQFVEFLKKHPEISKNTKFHTPPIFTVGFPRTGTTFLHELLGLHSDVKMHYTWEQMDPVPKTNDISAKALTEDRKNRYLKNKHRMEFFLGN